MCRVDWVLVNGFIAAAAALVNAALLFWMIRVTIRYVNITARNLNELRRQNNAIIEREVRPYRSLLTRSIQQLTALESRDLISVFESRDDRGWLLGNDLLPADFDQILQQAAAFNLDLYESLTKIRTDLFTGPGVVLSKMADVGRSGKATVLSELPKLQRDFRKLLATDIEALKIAKEHLEQMVPHDR